MVARDITRPVPLDAKQGGYTACDSLGVARRIEVTHLDGVKRTPQGGLRADAALTRSGVFVYRREDGSEVREYRSPEEVFKADSLATLASAPVTNLHPSELVTAENFKAHSKGHVGESVKQDGDKVTATLYIQDADLVRAVERGDMKQVSCGYTCDVVDSAGTTPSGERYDRAQTNIRYNHAAIVPVGRAGSEVALRLDAADNVIDPAAKAEPPKEPQMHKERIDGVDYEVGTDAHKAACERRDSMVKSAKDAQDKLQARADAAEADLAKAKAEIAELPKKISAQAAIRADLETKARKVLDAETKLDGLTEAEIRSLVVTKARPEMKLDGKSEAYVEALFDVAVAEGGSSDLAETRRDAVDVRPAASGELDEEAVRTDSLKKAGEFWKLSFDKFKDVA